jgi:hypothetical protein
MYLRLSWGLSVAGRLGPGKITMRTILSAVSLMSVAILPFGAHTAELKPLQAGTFVLGAQSVFIYYVPSGDTYEVVATVAPDAGAPSAPIRFVGFLQSGQKALVSAGDFGTTTAPETLELAHQASLLSVARLTKIATAN